MNTKLVKNFLTMLVLAPAFVWADATPTPTPCHNGVVNVPLNVTSLVFGTNSSI
jgi:hypothetical protein